MSRIDPEQERQRLMDFYFGQLDGELEEVAGQAGKLTEIAREALRAELSRRVSIPNHWNALLCRFPFRSRLQSRRLGSKRRRRNSLHGSTLTSP